MFCYQQQVGLVPFGGSNDTRKIDHSEMAIKDRSWVHHNNLHKENVYKKPKKKKGVIEKLMIPVINECLKHIKRVDNIFLIRNVQNKENGTTSLDIDIK